ncbi:MAG: hypothetical protein R6U44_07050 [Archaeoglobaceae archaeon]
MNRLICLIFCLSMVFLAGCTQPQPHFQEEVSGPQNDSSNLPSPNSALGGVFEHFMIINPGETKSTTYTLFSGGEEGNVSLFILSVDSLFSTDRKEMLEGVNISMEPSQFTVKPNSVYKSNITVETDSDVSGVHDNQSVSWETVVLLIQARVNGKEINDWYRVYIDPKTDRRVPSLLHLRREASPKLEHEESVVMDRGSETSLNLTIRTLKAPGGLNISAYEVGEIKNGLDVTIKPSYHLPPDSMSWNESKIIIDATRASPGNHSLCILLHHQAGILDVSWLKVGVTR